MNMLVLGQPPSLQPLYAAGFIGIQADGLLAVRDIESVLLKDRNQVNKLVAAENADRQSLYQAIADANGHPIGLYKLNQPLPVAG